MPEPPARERSIKDHAIIGDCHSVALVCGDGEIDWACLRRFDRSPAFGRLLDEARGGSFRIRPKGLQSVSRCYLEDSNVLETTFVTATGTLRLRDAFAMRSGGSRRPHHQLIRHLSCDRASPGPIEVEVEIAPRFDFGACHPWLRERGPGFISAVGGDDALVIWSDAPLPIDRAAISLKTSLTLRAGEARRFSIVAAEAEALDFSPLTPEEIDRRLEETLAWWRRWTAQGTYPERYRAQVIRSALTLKLLTCAPTGAIVAAATTSLPERIGGDRNFDYRYAWVRDASMTMSALVSVGHHEVAGGLFQFLLRSSAGATNELQIMYGCHGQRRLTEIELPDVAGFRGSKPVRVGNAAHGQLQLDVYGELLDAAWLWDRTGDPIDGDGWRFLRSVVDHAVRRWEEPDRGIWEERGEPEHFVYSKAMCWVAIRRGLQIAAARGLEADTDTWQKAAAAIRESIDAHGVDQGRGCFRRSYGSSEVDASLLRLPLTGYIAADDPRMIATVDAIRADLSSGALLHRYRTGATGNVATDVPDGFKGEEGAFLACSFWLADVLAMQGRQAEAARLFDELIACANDVGLYAEQIDPHSLEFLGNFPLALNHMAVINTARQLSPEVSPESRKLPVSERHDGHPTRPAAKPATSATRDTPSPLPTSGASEGSL